MYCSVLYIYGFVVCCFCHVLNPHLKCPTHSHVSKQTPEGISDLASRGRSHTVERQRTLLGCSSSERNREKLSGWIVADSRKTISWSTSTLDARRQTTFTEKTTESVTSDDWKMTRNAESQDTLGLPSLALCCQLNIFN